MDIHTSALANEIQALKDAYAALNRNDIPAFVSLLDPQIERIEFAELPQGSAYHGLHEVTQHIVKARGTWAEGSCEPQHFIVVGDRIVVIVDVRVRLKAETQWRQAQTADVFIFRGGKAVLFRTFADELQALAWAKADAK